MHERRRFRTLSHCKPYWTPSKQLRRISRIIRRRYRTNRLWPCNLHETRILCTWLSSLIPKWELTDVLPPTHWQHLTLVALHTGRIARALVNSGSGARRVEAHSFENRIATNTARRCTERPSLRISPHSRSVPSGIDAWGWMDDREAFPNMLATRVSTAPPA